jgi:hypothetical protein
MIATEMVNIFLKKGVPVVPSLGEFRDIHAWECLTQFMNAL